jgi:uncharacterized protein (DUF302 family)
MNSANGIITKTAGCTVEEAVSKIKSLLVIRGITLFAVIDHSGEAEAIGMKMPDTKLVIFGNSKGGTLCFKLCLSNAYLRCSASRGLSFPPIHSHRDQR